MEMQETRAKAHIACVSCNYDLFSIEQMLPDMCTIFYNLLFHDDKYLVTVRTVYTEWVKIFYHSKPKT